jgi:hypothetical protein
MFIGDVTDIDVTGLLVDVDVTGTADLIVDVDVTGTGTAGLLPNPPIYLFFQYFFLFKKMQWIHINSGHDGVSKSCD